MRRHTCIGLGFSGVIISGIALGVVIFNNVAQTVSVISSFPMLARFLTVAIISGLFYTGSSFGLKK